MPDVHFDRTTIEVGYFTDLWGPYGFSFPIASSLTANDGLIPYGDTIASVTVKAYLGSVDRTSDLTSATEITTLVDPAYTPTITDGYVVWIKFQDPGSTYHAQLATLVFEVTLTSGGKKDFYFQHVDIK